MKWIRKKYASYKLKKHSIYLQKYFGSHNIFGHYSSKDWSLENSAISVGPCRFIEKQTPKNVYISEEIDKEICDASFFKGNRETKYNYITWCLKNFIHNDTIKPLSVIFDRVNSTLIF